MRQIAREPKRRATRWLASALRKIASAAEQIPNDDAEQNPATAHLFIINPLSGKGMDNLFSTHPSVENRILRLQEMARAIGESPREGAGPGPATAGPWGMPAREEPESRGPWG